MTLEPVYLEFEIARPTEYGKAWLERRHNETERFGKLLRDIDVLATSEHLEWPAIQAILIEEGAPTALTSGPTQYAAAKQVDASTGKTTYTTVTPTYLGLWTSAVTQTSTGVTSGEGSYTTYGRVSIAAGGWNAATAAYPSVASNTSILTFGACTGGTNTFTQFLILESSSGAGNAVWWGGLTSTVISTTQTPPTVAASALTVSLTGS